jgi:HPt (histidine-containing phosphotransfer) domain-containing protein
MTDATDLTGAETETQSSSGEGKSILSTLGLVLGVIVFIALLAGIVIVNSGIAVKAKSTLAGVNAANLQSARVGRMGSDLLQIQRETRAGRDASALQADLASVAAAFDQTESALKRGGRIQDAAGNDVAIDPLGPEVSQKLADADGYWATIHTYVNAYSSNRSPSALDNAVAAATRTGPRLSDTMNQVALQVSDTSSIDVASLSSTRNLMTALSVITFVVIIASLLGRVREGQRTVLLYTESLNQKIKDAEESARLLAEAKAGSDMIMETVTQGLFLIDPSYRIAGEYSRELEQIFRMPDLTGFNLLNILQRLLTERMFNTSKDYFALLFDKTKKQRTVLQVNPLAQIEVNFPNSEGGYTSRFLNFSFRRIVEDGKITRVFVAVSDVTERVQLEHELRAAEARKERQFEFLLGVLHIEPKQLDDFMNTAREQIAIMNDALRAQDFAGASSGQMDILRQRLDVVYSSVHNIKGNAMMLKLSYFQNICQEFESKIVSLRNRVALGGDDFLAIVISQSELSKDLDELQEVRQRFLGIGRGGMTPEMAALSTNGAPSTNGAARPAADPLLTPLATLAGEMAKSNGKEVRVEAQGFDTHLLSDAMRRSVKDVLIQLTRNSLAHGIESPTERESLGKPRGGTISIKGLMDLPIDQFGFTFRDDGHGLDPDRIRGRAIAKGLVTETNARTMTSRDVVGLIFSPGFSTAESTTDDAGRGIGMNLVKNIVVDQYGGKINVTSEVPRYTEITIIMPLGARTIEPAEDQRAQLVES